MGHHLRKAHKSARRLQFPSKISEDCVGICGWKSKVHKTLYQSIKALKRRENLTFSFEVSQMWSVMFSI